MGGDEVGEIGDSFCVFRITEAIGDAGAIDVVHVRTASRRWRPAIHRGAC